MKTQTKPDSKTLNSMYAAFCAGWDKGELLQAVFDKAVWVLQDEDAAQEFVIGVWRVLPVETSSFSAWIRSRLKWKAARKFNEDASNPEIPVSHLLGPDDESTEDKLDELYYKNTHASSNVPDLSRLPKFIASVSGMLLAGFTQKEIADYFGMSIRTLEDRIRAYRNKL